MSHKSIGRWHNSPEESNLLKALFPNQATLTHLNQASLDAIRAIVAEEVRKALAAVEEEKAKGEQ